jgi:D-lactate dehydrogenase (cytochrome)
LGPRFSRAEMGRAEALHAAMVDRASAVDGTCTGEHGVNIGKLAKMAKERPTAIPYRRALEHALDPDAIMNPAKIVTVE